MAEPGWGRLVLASASPRRRELLASLGVSFDVRPADLDEAPHPGESATSCVERLAREKATAVGLPGEVVVAADTTVLFDGRMLGKPDGTEDARAILAELAGNTHTVHTGVAIRVLGDGGTVGAAITVVSTDVTLTDMSPEDIDWYVRTGEPLDKAGGYGLQGAGGLFVARIVGSHSNVIGLPLAETVALLRSRGVDLLTSPLTAR